MRWTPGGTSGDIEDDRNTTGGGGGGFGGMHIGIGGLPSRLLRRCGQLLAPAGRILIEAEPGNVDDQVTAWLEHPDGRRGPSFPWARLGTDAVLRAAAGSGLRVMKHWREADRAFVWAARSR